MAGAGTIANNLARRGVMLVLSSPSGAGKSTIARNMLNAFPDLTLSVSVTTRARRGSEIDGTHYRFISETEFQRMRDSDALLEWAEVHGNFYGTPRDPAIQAMQEGRDMLFDIDWQGTRQLYEKSRADLVSVFVLPPSAGELRNRLERRAEDSAEIILERLANAREELSHWGEYDYLIVNRDLNDSLEALHAILKAERQRRTRLPAMADFVAALQNDL